MPKCYDIFRIRNLAWTTRKIFQIIKNLKNFESLPNYLVAEFALENIFQLFLNIKYYPTFLPSSD